jgi:type IV pilus assembly protein PilX
MSRHPWSRSSRSARGQSGVILFVALLATIALTLAGIALDRAVSTDVAIGGNIAMRQHAMLAASAAIEHALAALFESGTIADKTTDDIPHNYFAASQAGEDVRGVPHALQSVTNYPVGAPTIDAGEGYTLRHVVERLCLLPGIASADNCTLSPPSLAAASGTPTASEPPRTPYYRVTVRVDGPAGAAAFVQAMLGEEPSHHRLSWRVLDE